MVISSDRKICACGSSDVVYVVQKGRTQACECYCPLCVPVVGAGKNEELKKTVLKEKRS